MSMIKTYLHQIQVEEQELWDSYLDWVSDNRDTFQQLPKNIKDIVEDKV